MQIANKTDAAIELMRECCRDKCTNAAAKRALKACRLLGIEDTTRVFSYLGYCRADGMPYNDRITRIW